MEWNVSYAIFISIISFTKESNNIIGNYGINRKI